MSGSASTARTEERHERSSAECRSSRCGRFDRRSMELTGRRTQSAARPRRRNVEKRNSRRAVPWVLLDRARALDRRPCDADDDSAPGTSRPRGHQPMALLLESRCRRPQHATPPPVTAPPRISRGRAQRSSPYRCRASQREGTPAIDKRRQQLDPQAIRPPPDCPTASWTAGRAPSQPMSLLAPHYPAW